MFRKLFFSDSSLPCKSGFAEIFVVGHEAFYISVEVNQSRDSSRTNLAKVFPDGKFINWDMQKRKQILHEIEPHKAMPIVESDEIERLLLNHRYV